MKRIVPLAMYSEVFGRPLPEDALALLDRVPTDLVLMYLFRLNALLFHPRTDHTKRQLEILQEMFPHLDPTQKTMLMAYLAKASQHAHMELTFFCGPATNWLIRQCFDHFVAMTEENMVEPAALEPLVFTTLLIANEKYFHDPYDFPLTSCQAIWSITLKQQKFIRRTALSIGYYFLKSLFFKKFIEEQFSTGPQYIDEFSRAVGFTRFHDYHRFLVGLMSQISQSFWKENKVFWNIETTEENQRFVDLFSTKPSDFQASSPTDSADSLTKPFYLLMDQYFAVIDLQYFGFLLDKAIIFQFYMLTTIRQSEGFNNFVDFKSFLGHQFFERYMTAAILKTIFHRWTFLTGEQINNLTDVVLIEGRYIYVIEIKGVEMHYKDAQQNDVVLFQQWLQKNFLQRKTSTKPAKGVYQLVSCIERLADDPALLSLSEKNLQQYSIIPIVIYADALLDCGAVNTFCNESFLPSVGLLRNTFRHIYPVTLINIQFLIEHFFALQKDPAAIRRDIVAYHKKVASNRQSFKKNKLEMIYFNAQASFADHVSDVYPFSSTPVRAIAEALQLST